MTTVADQFVVVDVGCIECGADTEVVGVFSTREVAEAAQRTRAERHGSLDGWSYFAGEEHHVRVFELNMVPDPATL